MSAFTNMNDDNPRMAWNSPSNSFIDNQFYETGYSGFLNQNLEFTTPDQVYDGSFSNDYSQMYNPNMYTKPVQDQDYDEPPLLEELEIYPERILVKIKAVLNPFSDANLTNNADYLMQDPDLAGPIFFYFILAISLFLSGNKAHFGYIYGISVISCLIMFCLLTLMSVQNGIFNLTTVASILGYSLIPIVGLSLIGILITLYSTIGVLLAICAVIWSSISASRLFVAISGDQDQQLLIAYPCLLLSGVYALLIIF